MRAAVIGSSGHNSAAWTHAFLAAGFEVIQLVRHPLPPEPGASPSQRRFDLGDAGTYGPALAGADVLGLVTPSVPGQAERELAVADAATQAGVARIVKLSVTGADLTPPISQFARWHAAAEAGLRERGIPSVVLRPNFFMQNFLRQRAAIEAGTYRHYAGEQRVSYLDVADIARVAAVVARGGFDGQTLELTGPESLGADEVARLLTAAAGRPVQVVPVTPRELEAALLAQGAPAWLAAIQAELYQAVQDGRAVHVEAVTPAVEAVTGQAPRGLGQFLADAFGS